MKLCLALALVSVTSAYGYEYTLQFHPPSGARGIIVAGYEFIGNTVEGNCSYYVSRSAGGRGGHSITTYYHNTCSWDLFGNLKSLTPQPTPVTVPIAISKNGTKTVYAIKGSSSAGLDTRGFGFVNTPSSHFSFLTPSSYAVLPYGAHTMTVTVSSDGDFPLDYDGADVITSITGTYTPSAGSAKVVSTNCPASIAVHSSCTITVSYDPRTISCSSSPYGYGYTKLSLALITDAGANPEFTEGFTITGLPLCEE